MSIRMAASWGQPRQLRSVPRGARTGRAPGREPAESTETMATPRRTGRQARRRITRHRSSSSAGAQSAGTSVGTVGRSGPGRRGQPRGGSNLVGVFIIDSLPGVVAPGAGAGGGVDRMAVGIIGAGWIAKEHYRILGSLAGAEVVAVCDVGRERAEALAGGTGARVYVDWQELLDREDLAALVVCTPPLSHRAPAIAALDRGLPVYLEKPIARTAENAAAIVAAAERTGTVCAIGYQWHALDLLDDLRRLLEGQQIGLLVGTSIGPTQSRPWFLNRRAGGGNLLERGSHHFDLARVIGGDVTSVQAGAGRVRLARSADGDGDGDIDDAVTILLTLASGALATVLVA